MIARGTCLGACNSSWGASGPPCVRRDAQRRGRGAGAGRREAHAPACPGRPAASHPAPPGSPRGPPSGYRPGSVAVRGLAPAAKRFARPLVRWGVRFEGAEELAWPLTKHSRIASSGILKHTRATFCKCPPTPARLGGALNGAASRHLSRAGECGAADVEHRKTAKRGRLEQPCTLDTDL